MSKNRYLPFNSEWDVEQWEQYCPDLEYRIKRIEELPPFLPKRLTEKFNCALIAASGNGPHRTFLIQGYRIDGSELDEHQYIATFNLANGQKHAGFIDHGSYPGRTTEIPKDMIDCMSKSGIYIDFKFDRKPNQDSGSLNDLKENGLISGFENSVAVQERKISPTRRCS